MNIIKIINAEDKTLIGSIWELNGEIATCIEKCNSKYTEGFKINIEVLGFYESEKLFFIGD